MWIKCKDRLPNKDGIYLVVQRLGKYNIYRIATYRQNLGNTFGLEEYDGEKGFYDSDSEWGSFVVEPEAWQTIEEYEVEDGKI